jgi:asparagine synthase (glutamine-hydrolysing)
MCGIIGISSSKNEQQQLYNSLDEISHRGPDDRGVFFSENNDCQLGHVRLSIIDTTQDGHQPMLDITERFVISYNGEIYNYQTLKKNLENVYGSINWKSKTDTEVILEGFAREGVSFLSKLNGVFAFSIYDKEEKTLSVLRDPIGVKPLYFTNQKGSVYFCSELKGLLTFPHLKRTLRHQSLADQLAFMYVPEPFTMFNEFFKIEPGVLNVFQDGKLTLQRPLFDHLFDKIDFSSENKMIDSFRETFSSSVKRQLVSDVPVSILLSGGLDSSAIAYEAVKNGANIKTAYTISFLKKDSKYDKQSDDLHYAKKVADQLGLNLKIINAEPELISLLPELIPFMEDGISDPAAINTFLISEKARKDGVKVLLSGVGADEYLCGYRRCLAESIISKTPKYQKKIFSILSSLIPSSVPGRFYAAVRRIHSFSFSLKQEKSERLPGYYMWGKSMDIKDLFLNKSSIHPGENLKKFFESNSCKNTLETMLLADQKFDLLSLNLSYTDKMTMISGVEARAPFLDLQMIKLMNSIPISMKLKGIEQKHILKKVMESCLPKGVVYRKKAGFALPIRAWFRKRNEIIERYFNFNRIKKQGIFDPNKIEEILENQFSGKKDYSYLLFSMLCQQIWLDKQFKTNIK